MSLAEEEQAPRKGFRLGIKRGRHVIKGVVRGAEQAIRISNAKAYSPGGAIDADRGGHGVLLGAADNSCQAPSCARRRGEGPASWHPAEIGD